MFIRREIIGAGDAVILESTHAWSRRQTSGGGLSKNSKAVIIVAVVLGVVLCAGLLLTLLLRYLRINHEEPKYIPTRYLKDKWRNWLPSAEKKKRYSSSLQRRSTTPGQMSISQLNLAMAANTTAGATVDRHTSVRSTITLPAYSATPRSTESVMGRAGERAGDTILEFPETIEEEEARRDAEAEALFQIRQARRDERSDREERQRLRREAQRTGDQVALQALTEASQAARRGEHLASQRSAEELIREHRARNRTQRVPEVEYAEVGIARHDGSRIRASSTASDNAPLLDEAASMGTGRPRAGTGDSSRSRSMTPGRRFFGHIRNISQSSLRFATTDNNSDDEDRRSDEGAGTPRAQSRGGLSDPDEPSIPRTPSGRVIDPPQYEGNEWNDVELASPGPTPPQPAARRQSIPRETPPSYPWLPALGPLPTIEITPFDTDYSTTR